VVTLENTASCYPFAQHKTFSLFVLFLREEEEFVEGGVRRGKFFAWLKES
jgi:hypothetical protein